MREMSQTLDTMTESETCEFKKSLSEIKEGLVSIAAILNKHGQGDLWFGIKNDGHPVGLEINEKTLREAVINAFCHRDWRDPESVRVAIYTDRVEIQNPGSLPEGLTVERMRQGHISRRRNPLVADLLRRIHLVEAWGRGMPLILEKAPQVEFENVADIFIARFVRPPDAAQEKSSVKSSVKSSGKTLLKTLGKTTQETTQEKKKPQLLSAAKDKGRISGVHVNRLTCLGLRTHV